MTVSAFFEDSFETLYSGAYQSLSVADMDHDGFDEIMITANTPGKDAYHALMLDYENGGLSASAAAPLSQGMTLQNVLTANVGFDRVALLCEGYIERYGYVTDVILCAADGTLVNVYRSELTGVSDDGPQLSRLVHGCEQRRYRGAARAARGHGGIGRTSRENDAHRLVPLRRKRGAGGFIHHLLSRRRGLVYAPARTACVERFARAVR